MRRPLNIFPPFRVEAARVRELSTRPFPCLTHHLSSSRSPAGGANFFPPPLFCVSDELLLPRDASPSSLLLPDPPIIPFFFFFCVRSSPPRTDGLHVIQLHPAEPDSSSLPLPLRSRRPTFFLRSWSTHLFSLPFLFLLSCTCSLCSSVPLFFFPSPINSG